jgi:voltage-gated potassium channel
VDERSEELKRKFELPMLVAAMLMIPVIVIEQSDANSSLKTVADVLNWGVWLAFVFEMAVMLWVVPDKRLWLRKHPLEVAIVIATPPFLPASLEAARIFRLLRLLVLVRAIVLARRVFSLEGLRDAAVISLVTVLAGGAAFAAVEKGEDLSAWDGVWWAITTVTTVGYGDIAPKTDTGRAIGIIVTVVGIAFITLLTAAAAERYIEKAAKDAKIDAHLQEISTRLDAIERNQGSRG